MCCSYDVQPWQNKEVSLQPESARRHVFKYSTESALLCRSFGEFSVSFLHQLRRKHHGRVLWVEFRTFRRRPFSFWPTNRMWKVPWRRRRSPSVSHSTTSQHTHGTYKAAAHWQEKGELNTHLTHSALSDITADVASTRRFFCLPPVYLPVWTGWRPRLLQTSTNFPRN